LLEHQTIVRLTSKKKKKTANVKPILFAGNRFRFLLASIQSRLHPALALLDHRPTGAVFMRWISMASEFSVCPERKLFTVFTRGLACPRVAMARPPNKSPLFLSWVWELAIQFPPSSPRPNWCRVFNAKRTHRPVCCVPALISQRGAAPYGPRLNLASHPAPSTPLPTGRCCWLRSVASQIAIWPFENARGLPRKSIR